MCLYPVLRVNKKYTANKKNDGIIPIVFDDRTLYVPVGCGNCIECRKKKARDWQVRLQEDIKTNTTGKFITLTLSNQSYKKLHDTVQQQITDALHKLETNNIKNETTNKKIATLNRQRTGYDLDNAIATLAVKYFRERWRKHYGKSIRHWLITELGHNGTENIHMHGIIWTTKSMEIVEKHWEYGYIWKGNYINGKYQNYVSEKTINYMIKYIYKMDTIHTGYKSIILTSSGIGKNYVNRNDAQKNRYIGADTKDTYKTNSGHDISLPIYYRNKIYTDEERELLWLHKLNKQERWVLGKRIDISKGLGKYFKALKYAQSQNIKLGYRDNTTDWNKLEYEKKQRELKQLQRLKNTQYK